MPAGPFYTLVFLGSGHWMGFPSHAAKTGKKRERSRLLFNGFHLFHSAARMSERRPPLPPQRQRSRIESLGALRHFTLTGKKVSPLGF